MKLTDEQLQALDTIIELRDRRQREILVAGPAGTGKTTLIKALLLAMPDEDIEVVTPTNKAAKVLCSKGVPAATLYARFFTPETDLHPEITPEREAQMRAEGASEATIQEAKQAHKLSKKSVRFIPNHQLDEVGAGKRRFADTIVVDEASMLSTWLLRALMKMCNTLILVGDPHQLPPVNDKINPGGYFCETDPHVALETVMRQASDSPVLDLATHIRNGRFPEALVRSMAPSVAFADWFRPDRKIIAFTNAHRRKVNMFARQVLGRSGLLPVKGDLLICNTNTEEGLLNGSEVEVIEFKWKRDVKREGFSKPVLTGDFDALLTYKNEDGETKATGLNLGAFLRDLPEDALSDWNVDSFIEASSKTGDGHSFSYGYCITAHKAQGSEWDEVCVIDERFVLGKIDPTGDTSRRWLYTSVTRAAKRLVFADYRWIKASEQVRRAA